MAKFTRAEIRRIVGDNCTDDVETALIALHHGIVDDVRDQLDAAKADAQRLKDKAEQAAALQQELDALKSGGDFKAKYEELKNKFDAYKAEVTGKEQREKLAAAYKERLTAAGIDPKRFDAIMRAKAPDLAKLKLNPDGKLQDEETIDKGILDEWGGFVLTTTTKGEHVPTPPAQGGKTLTREDIYRKDENGRYVMNTEQRQKALAENPQLMRNGG